MTNVRMLPKFEQGAKRLKLTKAELDGIISTLLKNPRRGDDMGGVLKARHAFRGRTARGGLRTLHHYDVEMDSILLLGLLDKSEDANFTPKQVREMKALAKALRAEQRTE